MRIRIWLQLKQLAAKWKVQVSADNYPSDLAQFTKSEAQ
jgi:hypothetical protein